MPLDPSNVDLSVDLGHGLVAKNPVMLASGTAGYGPELSAGLDMSVLGGFVTKGIAVNPWEGNAPPRIAETKAGMLNAIGLQNVGLEAFLEEKVPYLRSLRADSGAVVAVNVIGRTVAEYHDVARGRSPFFKLQDRGLVDRVCVDADIEAAIDTPPQTTRARLRGEFVKRAKERRRDYTVDWVHLKLNDQAQRTVLCKDPFKSRDERVEKLIESL